MLPVIVVIVGVALMFLVVWLEKSYYDRHPEKERPDVDPWP